jgi:hypothetical protein
MPQMANTFHLVKINKLKRHARRYFIKEDAKCNHKTQRNATRWKSKAITTTNFGNERIKIKFVEFKA